MDAPKNHSVHGVFYYDSTVCEGYARAYNLLLNTAGVKSEYVGATPTSDNADGHAWNLVTINDVQYHVDVCWDDMAENKIHYFDFMKSEVEFKRSHRSFEWDNEITKSYSTLLIGDLNHDKYYDCVDSQLLREYLNNNITLDEMELYAADVNMDGIIDANDYKNLTAYVDRDRNLYPASITVFEYLFIHDQVCQTVLLGDVNLDNKLNNQDLILMQDYLLDRTVFETSDQFFNADLNLDGVFDGFDMAIFKRKFAVIVTQPSDVAVGLGKIVETSVEATGDGLTYQWFYKNPGQTSFSKSSIKSSRYAISMNTQSDGRQIYCVVTDKYGYSVKTRTATLRSKVVITNQPADVSIAINTTAKTYIYQQQATDLNTSGIIRSPKWQIFLSLQLHQIHIHLR